MWLAAAVVGIAIRTRGRRSRLALPSLLVVGDRVFGGRGRRSWSWLPSALVVDGRCRRSDQHPCASVAVGAAISIHGRRAWLALPSGLMVVVGAAISGVRRSWLVMRPAHGRRCGGRRFDQRWSSVVVNAAISAHVVDGSGRRCHQLMVGSHVVGGGGRHCHQYSWSTVVVGAAIIARGQRSCFRRSWSVVVVVAAISARGRRSSSAL